MKLRNPPEIVDKIATYFFKKGFVKKLYFIFDEPLKIGERNFIGVIVFVFIGISLISFSSANTVEAHVYVTVLSDPAHAETISYSEGEFICRGWQFQGSHVDNMTLKIYNSSGSLIYSETDPTDSNQECVGVGKYGDEYNYSCLNYSFEYALPYEDNFEWSCEACNDYVGEFDSNGSCRTTENESILQITTFNYSVFPSEEIPYLVGNDSKDFREIKGAPNIQMNQTKNFTPITYIKLNSLLPLIMTAITMI